MNRQLKFHVKEHLRKRMKQVRQSHCLSQEKMATLLYIERRSYCDIERGRNTCGLITFLAFLQMLPDPADEIDQLLTLCGEITENDAA